MSCLHSALKACQESCIHATSNGYFTNCLLLGLPSVRVVSDDQSAQALSVMFLWYLQEMCALSHMIVLHWHFQRSFSVNLQELDLNMLLMSIHDYFMGLGVDEIRRRGAEDDKPLRMVKTILHELCKLKVCHSLCSPLTSQQRNCLQIMWLPDVEASIAIQH